MSAHCHSRSRISSDMFYPVPASQRCQPCYHAATLEEHVNDSIKPVLMKNAFHSWCPMFRTSWLAMMDPKTSQGNTL